MASTPLIIRNLTSVQTELKLVERYEAPTQGLETELNINSIAKNFTALMSNITQPSAPQLALKSESFSNQDVAVPVAPFESKETDIQPNSKEVMRLTFETEGQRYRLDIPTPSEKSSVLTPLSPDPRHEYTAIYLPKSSHLALFSSAKLESWMSKLKDKSPLSALSIPGTHNSPTHYTALPSVRCQAVSVREQLDNGVRFLDIRVQPEDPDDLSKDGLLLVHSAFPISLTGNKYFRDLVNEVDSFLDQNPSETVIISLKREGTGKATDQQFSKILKQHYAGDTNRWFTEPRIPTLGEVRKKIVLMRRFNLDDSLKNEWDGKGWGIDGSNWPDNCADGICSSGDIRVQDFYEIKETVNIDTKVEYSLAHLGRSGQSVCHLPDDDDLTAAAISAEKQPFFINFLSASNFFNPGCWPDRIAARINPSIIDFLCQSHNEKGQNEVGDGSTGIVVCDWVGNNGNWDLVRAIVGHNAKLELREKK